MHTPEICYSSREYDLLGDRKAVTVKDNDGVEHTFWQTEFKSQRPGGAGLRVYYAWTNGGPWTASASPRFEFALKPWLVKLQLAATVDLENETARTPARDSSGACSTQTGNCWQCRTKTRAETSLEHELAK